jgi:beta-carotene ketolase (CrtO type)
MAHDVVVIGGGHNGLTCAAYLAQAGLDVAVFERRDVLGGCGTSEATIASAPGFTFNAGAFDLLGFTQQPVYRDFQLDRHGLELLPTDPFFFMPFPDGRHIFIYRSPERTAESIGSISPADAKSYLRYVAFWSQLDDLAGPFYSRSAPLPGRRPNGAAARRAGLYRAQASVLRTAQALGFAARIARSRDIAEMCRVALMPARSYIAEHFESSEVQGLMAFFAMQTTLDQPGSVLAMTELVASHTAGVARPRGGMGEVSRAIARAFETHGGRIVRNAHVDEIVVERGRAVGVRLAGGETVRAREAVVAAISPQRVFLRLIEARHLTPAFRRRVEHIQNDDIAVIKAYYALAEPPIFSGCGDDGSRREFRTASGMICESVAAADAMWADLRAGHLPRRPAWIWCTLSTGLDPSMAPPGMHALGLHMWVPYRLADGRHWHEAKEEAVMLMLDAYCQHAPNLKGKVIAWDARTPTDWEDLTDNPKGNNFHVDVVPHQVFGFRPLPELSDYRTPITGLYLSGAGTHPGPAITGLPGHNTAHTILEDLGAPRRRAHSWHP